jgi:pyruvate carboxylase
VLVKALRDEIGLPIHFHTHDTGGVQAAAILNAAEVGLDIADGAIASMSGGTSQPNLNTMVEGLAFTPRSSTLNATSLDEISEFWRETREFYTAFESPVLAAGADLYQHEMPGGQYTNLFQQAQALGLDDRWPEICRLYADVNQLFGDIVKVTPTSKAVGDMALFLVANDLSCDALMQSDRELAFPRSVLDLLGGRMGQVEGGFPPIVRDRILGSEKPLEGRPGESIPPADLKAATEKVAKMVEGTPTERDIVSYLMYPQVFEQYAQHVERYSYTSLLPTPVYLHGMETGEEIAVDIEPGKTLIIKFLAIGDPHADGTRTVFFELNGQPRDVTIQDLSLKSETPTAVKADPDNPKHVGASMPGMVVRIAVQKDDSVAKGQKLLTLEAMKMETTVAAEIAGKVANVHVTTGTTVQAGDLLITLE